MTSPVLPITAIYAALATVLVAVLMLRVIQLRRQLKIGIGDGGNKQLHCAIRAHGNSIETIPMFLVLMAILEANGGKPMFLYVCGTLFLVARVLHAIGLSGYGGASMGRVSGTVVTVGILLALAGTNLLKVLS